MVFADGTTALYIPIAGSAGASLWGTDVRKVLASPDATTDATTVSNHGTGGVVTRTYDPYTTLNTDQNQADYGWAIQPSDMGSVTGALRQYAAGNHVLSVRFNQNAAAGASITLLMYAYRVGNAAGGRVRTLLGSGSTTFNSDAAGVVSTRTVTVALGAVTFGDDETIAYGFEVTAPGVAVTGRNTTFRTGTQGGVASRVDTPPLATAQTLTVVGFDPAVAFGTPALQRSLPVTGFDVPIQFGAATITPDTTLNVAGFDVTVLFGVPTIVPDQSVAVSGFDLLVEFGTPTVILDNVLLVDGFDAPIQFGAPSVALQPTVFGTVFNHETGDPLGAGIVVKLFDDNDLLIDSTVTDGAGGFVFYRPHGDTDTYWTYAEYELLGVQYHGTSDRDCPAT